MRVNLRPILAGTLLLGAVACTEDDPELAGYVRLELRRDAVAQSDPFVDTVRLRAQLNYGPCISDYYRANPNMQIDGIDGAPIFQEWSQRICDRGEFGNAIQCEIANLSDGYNQLIMDSDQQGVSSLIIDYTVLDDNIENFSVIFGPLPTIEATKSCAPEVLVSPSNAARGYRVGPSGAPSQEVWRVSSLQSGTTLAETNQGGAIRMNVARTSGD